MVTCLMGRDQKTVTGSAVDNGIPIIMGFKSFRLIRVSNMTSWVRSGCSQPKHECNGSITDDDSRMPAIGFSMGT